jgi:hypothetical protein
MRASSPARPTRGARATPNPIPQTDWGPGPDLSSRFPGTATPRSPRRTPSRANYDTERVGKATTSPATRVEIDGQVAAVSLVVENGRVTRIYAVADPPKLTRLDQRAELVG